MHRLFLALPLALVLLAAPVLADSATAHVAAARKDAKAKKWNSALIQWQEAYRIQPNSEYLIGMGDAYAGMGDKANARKQYNAYLADPLALDLDGVKAKLASLDKGGGGADDLSLDLTAPPPAGGNDLDLAGPAPEPKSKKKKREVASNNDLSLDLTPAPAPAKKVDSNDLSLDLTPAPPPKKEEKKAVANNDLGLDLAPMPAPKKEEKKAVAANDLSLDLPGPAAPPAKGKVVVENNDPLSLDNLGAPPPKPAPAVVASNNRTPGTSSQSGNNQRVAVATTRTTQPAQPSVTMHQTAAPSESVATVHSEPRVVEHNNRVIAYCTAGLAVGSLAVGGLYFSKASQNLTDANSGVNQGAMKQELLDQNKTNNSVAFVGILAGVVLAGVTTAIFVF